MKQQGIGVLIMSTELQEILGMADRIIVMFDGQITGEFTREEATQESVIAAASGVGAGRQQQVVEVDIV